MVCCLSSEWTSQLKFCKMAVIRTKPNGRVLGVDINPAQPLKGVSAIQGNFLDPKVQAHLQRLLRGPERDKSSEISDTRSVKSKGNLNSTSQDHSERTVDVVLSDMSAPLPPLLFFLSFESEAH